MAEALSIRILGAGVSGLAAAIALARSGHEVELIDEHFSVPTVGTALGLFRPAQRVLAHLEVLDEVRALSTAPRSGTLRTAEGRILATVPAGDALLVPRSDLVRVLGNALPREVARRHQRVEDVRPLRGSADVLIGADGVHSLVRRSGWRGSSGARGHGVTVLRGTAPIAPPEISETWGVGWLFGITPLPEERTNWFACLPEHRAETRSQDLEHLRSAIGGRRAEIDAVLAVTTPEQTLVHGIHTAPPVWPVRENVALLGDAAHAMAPNLGHGANTALQDALALAQCLQDSPDVPAALRRYAARRALPGQSWRLGSHAMLRLATLERGAALRDRLLGALSPLAPAPPL